MSSNIWEQIEFLVELVESIATIFALFAAGLWAIFRLWKNRELQPRADITLDATVHAFDSENYWIHVEALIRNVGLVRIPLDRGYCRIQICMPSAEVTRVLQMDQVQLFHPGQLEVDWPLICKKEWGLAEKLGEIEPGESECLHFDFLAPVEVEATYIAFHIANPAKKGKLGWGCKKILELPRESAACQGRKLPMPEVS